jgi:hypothetical protein
MKNLKYKPCLAAMLMALSTASLQSGAQEQPVTDATQELEQNSLSSNQSQGYIGQVSESVILSGNLANLNASINYEDNYANGDTLLARVQFWHDVALDTVALDHTPEEGQGPSQGGPTRTSRAMAMVQIAVFDALNAFENRFNYFTWATTVPEGASADAAVATAAHRMLRRLYPNQKDRLNTIFDEEKDRIRSKVSNQSFKDGRDVGKFYFQDVLAERRGDRSGHNERDFGEGGRVADGNKTFFGTRVNGGTSLIGEWEPDPNTPSESGDFNLALGARWGNVKPFFLTAGNQFRSTPPPAFDSDAYSLSFADVAAIGGSPDNANTVSTSTEETRFVGNYWGYDGVPLIGVPPRIYNQIVAQVAGERIDNALDLARILALANVGMADTAIAVWDSKYYYNFWRPVTGIRRDDQIPSTVNDAAWDPVGMSVVNTNEAVRSSPPFPAYPSGHAAFGATIFEVLRESFGNNTAFTFVSDEYNGEGVDPFFPNIPRPFVPVRFETLTEAQLDNGISRIYNGVHWDFDNTAGQALGLGVARFLLDDTGAFQPQ